MNNRTLLTFIFLFFTLTATKAQDAKQILDKLSKKAASYSSMSATFEYTMKNTNDGIDESQKGSLITQGNKYHLTIAGQEVISDGKTVWTVIPDAQEVQINNVPEENDDADNISPTNILTLWEKGFKYEYDKEEKLNGKTVDIVNLYPMKPADKSYHTIKLYIDKTKSELNKIIIKGKDGTDFTYHINSFKTNENIPATTFTFNNPKYEKIDLR